MGRYPIYSKSAIGQARKLRRNLTMAERKLWNSLRHDQMGARFRRQVPVGPYIVDFLSIPAKLVIELDGSQHLRSPNREKDTARDDYLKRQGYQVLRFHNRQILNDHNSVLQTIFAKIQTIR